MSDCCSPRGYRTLFSERGARSHARRYRRRGLDKLSRSIAELIKQRGVEGTTMLEVGGGIGAIEIELLKAGVVRAVNVELTPTYEVAAVELLRETGLTERVERRVADFVTAGAEVEVADIVVLNRVICCYADMPRLATAAAEHTRGLLVLSFPNDSWWTRLGLAMLNLSFMVTRVQFRVFLHSPEAILAVLEKQGLRRRLNHRGLLWQVESLERVA